MSLSDYVLDLALIGVVFVQIRGRRLTARSLILPVAIVAYVAQQYLKAIPTAGNDLVLIVACAAAGTTLGTLAGLFTKVTRTDDGRPFARAGAAAAALWVVGVGFRFAFQLYASHGGGLRIYRFDLAHHLSTDAWVAALVLMAIGEALARTAVLGVRAFGPAWNVLHSSPRRSIIGAGEPSA